MPADADIVKYFALAATNTDCDTYSGGVSPYSNYAAAPALAATAPAAPGNLTATPYSDSTGSGVRLLWNDNSNNESGFIVQDKLDSDSNQAAWQQVGDTTPADQPWDTITLPDSQTYDLRVLATNAVGDSDPTLPGR